MSVAAIKIVQEEIARRKSNMDNIHCAHDMLDTLEARIVDRIEKELVEIPDDLDLLPSTTEVMGLLTHERRHGHG
jgi:hypothetical protein